MARLGFPRPFGLYDPRFERDACGIGFVARIDGQKTHEVLRQATTALANLAHRGAVSADGLTGDGAGVLTQIPHAFFRHALAQQGVPLEETPLLGVGVGFLPRAPEAQRTAVEIIEAVLEACGLPLLAWRTVPVDDTALGEKARATRPEIRQFFVRAPAGLDAPAFERLLYLARRRMEQRALHAGLEGFYIPSFSHRTIVYKGLLGADQLERFYPDLQNPAYETAIALFHQRYSTNTFPVWPLAQPFRLLAHNGEINTLQGNVNWMRAREPELESVLWGATLDEVLPAIQEGGSDSAALDNVLELLVMSGRDPLHAMLMLVPEAYEARADLEPNLRGFFEYHAGLTEPWDGPAALVFSEGRYAAAMLDRNGLRPQRYWITEDGLVVVGSETGIVPLPEDRVVEKGRLGPGMLLAVDTLEGRLLHDHEIKRAYARPVYRVWVERYRKRPPEPGFGPQAEGVPAEREAFVRFQKAFGYSKEDYDRILKPMAAEGKEPLGSMGDDTPLAVLSRQPQLLYRYFRQRFAQVTNPPIDPLRERLVMSLRTLVGPRTGFLEERPEAARLIEFPSPILTEAEFAWLKALDEPGFRACVLEARFPAAEGPEGLERRVETLVREAERAVEAGCTLLILSDRGVGPEWAPVPMLLATAAVHHHLIRAGKRMRAAIVCDTAEAREDHHFACLLGYGATLVHPYLAYASVRDLVRNDPRKAVDVPVETALANYRAAVEQGLLKVMAKMGISTVASYRGAQIFEALGIRREVIERYFTGTPSRIGGVGLREIAGDVLRFHAEAYTEPAGLPDRGLYRFRKEGEYHAWNPTVFKHLHKAVRTQDFAAYQAYAAAVDGRPPMALRDLLTWKKARTPLPLEAVEPAEAIVKRFRTQAMSHGALSREAHEVLAVAMNRIGAWSNSGEGGEDRRRYRPYAADAPEVSLARWHPRKGDWGNSQIKQVASGRFGVTPEYLVSARELEIKMAQGSKPGEGGQIPGFKVSGEIARLRRAAPGTPLISPPPHHDIYSIEDLAQLIHDLKRVNRQATVAVKLVAEAGVGTIAAGVAKGYADAILISGHDGGTGASPLTSIKHAGAPWELGLAETQQVLVMNDLRGRVRLRVDGGLKTGRDVVIAALLGAEEFGFGTAALIAIGCVMARQCHLNTCPVGIATQREDLRRRFPGVPEHAIAFMFFVAEHVRLILAEMGFRRLEEIIGRVDLLEPREDVSLPRGARLELSALLADPDPSGTKPRRSVVPRNDPPEVPSLDEALSREAAEALQTRAPLARRYRITNRERGVGARLSGEIARLYGDEGLPEGTVRAYFQGVAGQSFGAFLTRGVFLYLEGEAQDYVGKGMGGGTIVVRPPQSARVQPHESVILGNTVMYGATGGSLYAAGRAGERLCVRNSGGRAVVEGCGDHGCEYMTGGVVVVLGETGRNFGAGMTGGVAYVLDESGRFPDRYNPSMVRLERLEHELDEALLRALIERHYHLTQSPRAAALLEDWERALEHFWKVAPRPDLGTVTDQPLEARLLEQVRNEALSSVG
ncbi:glutamate synthase large subunit [Marinithermus hydrothermalis]|uniref:Glutamate synthase (Ferredoxin) n=1 Tax=Marinithermus hydrothermalis (strain DSM 14884 / JCM 11576 / T1) TaxID=869210 RepID=F2NK52_MARHT|nr:glutamate synthase large subunit [Marinithermus hydrothermalis]AEB12023.1 Glutamate synthase (ferredoxin) [Marinithermus hydrothermalis DSM 14884]